MCCIKQNMKTNDVFILGLNSIDHLYKRLVKETKSERKDYISVPGFLCFTLPGLISYDQSSCQSLDFH